jgi:hypothetical protein
MAQVPEAFHTTLTAEPSFRLEVSADPGGGRRGEGWGRGNLARRRAGMEVRGSVRTHAHIAMCNALYSYKSVIT